ncbi:hypothetical protein BST27_27565 [Mycobacterium intermedium]|uniref:Integral membrane protein n=1 Tax=Mycobacterium intermedium TaxID=28445 RepID=A0A1E3SFU1_MYCIE|nr:hypothetical protein [Mycobacterium intermedium]MCV6966155.1 hypothetical protein [Mycobacterium intermedium]ODR00955.1 hypothetical protein BHQ20_11200 [Mycobacterium intermedium]OPE47920.1 hypothetical protein BV508_20160 [Mycobacterium intermedium]ORA94775.1 hypothetical protein BST27_27565 [Mycobacterium intermedium]
MTAVVQRGSVVAPVFGLPMVAAAALESDGAAIVLAVAALTAVATSTVFRPAATLAVLLTMAVIAFSDPSYLLVALSGLCGVAYLVCRHAGPAADLVSTGPTIVGSLGFTFAGLVATAFPLQLPWLPLVAPLAILAIYVLATRPFLG